MGAGSDVITERSEAAEMSTKSPLPSGKDRNRSRIGDCLNITTGINEDDPMVEADHMMGIEVTEPTMPMASGMNNLEVSRHSTTSQNQSPSHKSNISNSKVIYRAVDESKNVFGATKAGPDGL